MNLDWNRKHGWRRRVNQRRLDIDMPDAVNAHEGMEQVDEERSWDYEWDYYDSVGSHDAFVLTVMPMNLEVGGYVHMIDGDWCGSAFTMCGMFDSDVVALQLPDFKSTDEVLKWAEIHRRPSSDVTCLGCLSHALMWGLE